MTRPDPYRNRIELLQGTLDMLILQALQWGPMHGYGIAQSIRLKSSQVLQVETGSLYPALHRLERRRWVRSAWKLTDSRQRAKFYQITSTGKEQLAADHQRWQAMVRAIAAVMAPGAPAKEES
ncbi:MAG TPA: PadR family transcriptional regulator [Acidobacteriaceae bacterium]|nr:PadR family transcriptional regulator [Acidobacteriaceae bacterium]